MANAFAYTCFDLLQNDTNDIISLKMRIQPGLVVVRLLIRDLGGTCIMVSLHSVGLSGLLALRRHSELPIHAHRNGWGLFSRSPDIGISYIAWQKFWRLAGADHLHVNGLSNKFSESDGSVTASARAARKSASRRASRQL